MMYSTNEPAFFMCFVTPFKNLTECPPSSDYASDPEPIVQFRPVRSNSGMELVAFYTLKKASTIRAYPLTFMLTFIFHLFTFHGSATISTAYKVLPCPSNLPHGSSQSRYRTLHQLHPLKSLLASCRDYP